ncbi:Hypothetical predicted protein [Lecanosticta acicola]|uniref:DUF8035 domain-containing protein n=1 Tax=Lecanosticta acicola TaxID=111012 RepID=A0AAI8Z5R1_9PEZI|nr:Hypothetical predicted protein [Lecanosticta acicola]
MEQKATSYNPKRPRPVSLSIHVPKVKPIAEISAPKTTGMSYNHHRPLSPGGRRIANPGRASENTLTDPYYQPRHNSYVSPRSSGGVIPISTQTFINVPPPTNSRPAERYDSYSGRPRRSSLVDTTRGAVGSTTQLPSRSRPAVIQQDFARPASPSKFARGEKEKYDYVTPASSQEPRTTTTTHKKLYSVDGDGAAKLVADVNIPGGAERHHKRRDSVDRSGYRAPVATDRERERERERGRRGYHTNGTHNSRPKEKSIDDDDAYSYTDPAGMYRDTEPRWREATRQRRGSMDRGGATSRERPVSMLDPALATFGVRNAAKEVGPPPSTRGWDKINDVGRTRSVREEPRQVAQSPVRGRTYAEPGAYGDQYYVPPRTNSTDRRTSVHNYEPYDHEDRREPRRPERRHSISRDARMDQSVERRGFGIRTDYRTESQNRYAGGRGSDESMEHSKYRDSGYGEPHRRETAPEYYPHDISRHEQEKRDREMAQRMQYDEYGRTRERGYSDIRDYSREPRRREDDKTYYNDYDRRERDGERDRERARQMEPPADRERDRHHHRRGTADRDREYNGRKESSPKTSAEPVAKPGLAQAATGGLAGAATAFGLTGLLNKLSDKREKEKEENLERDHTDRGERSERKDRDREREREREREDRDDRDQPRERRQAASDEPPYEREKEQNRHRDTDRGLGFAFEGPEPPRSAPPTNTEWNQNQDRRSEWSQQPQQSNAERTQERQTQDRNQDRVGQRDFEREREYSSKPAEQAASVQMPPPAVDADEDYRRRMEQVQRELGRTSDERGSDSDPDRERRRREREQRQRERESRNNGAASSVAGESTFSEAPPHPALRRSFEQDNQSSYGANASTTTASTMPGLSRKPSILDRPMANESAQIIDNSLSERRENRVRIVDPPTEEEERRPRGILKKPTEKFPEDPNAVREGVAPLKDATKKGIPPGARWTKIDRRLVNPEALEAAHERFEERLDCVIVLRVLTKEEIQKLADRTREIRDRRYEEDREERKTARKANGRNRDRRERDEYEHSDSEDEFKEKAPKMLEAPTTAGAPSADFSQRRSEREREAEPQYMSGGLGRRDDSQVRF